ncbi:hypothetical protein SLA2020_105320 [Shorea laevis]
MGQALGCVRVQESNVAIMERCGGFKNALKPGCHYVPWCCGCNVVGRVPLSLQPLDIRCETKTKDDVSVTVYASVQYRFGALERCYKEKAKDAFYNITSAKTKIRVHIVEGIGERVPKFDLEDAIEKKNQISSEVEKDLKEHMKVEGYEIHSLIIDIEPDVQVKTEMNDDYAATIKAKKAEAAIQLKIKEEEANMQLQIKRAEADAESKCLSGVGVAKQRKAIIDGLRDSVHAFTERVPGTTGKDVMDMELVTQYFDTIKEIGTSSKASHVFLLHGPDAVKDMSVKLRDDLLQGKVTVKETLLNK